MNEPRVHDFFLQVVRCPATRQPLHVAGADLVERINQAIAVGAVVGKDEERLTRRLDGGLVNADRSLLYPIYDEIPCLLADRAISLAPFALPNASTSVTP